MELAVLSGKGGTGKTTIAAALSELAKEVVRIDCDVDAPNLYLFYGGKDINKDSFYGEKIAVVDEDLCIKCGECTKYCKFNAIDNGIVNALKCEGCGVCVLVCPNEAIILTEEKSADTYVTETDEGIISRAEMDIGSEGSGKLITVLRKKGKEYKRDNDIIIIDSSPGIGCSVISSITNSDAVLIVVEPTKSGMEDFMRVAALCEHFRILTLVCINKYDINEDIAKEIKELCLQEGFILVGEIPYDDIVMKSINELKPIVYYSNSTANKAIREMWENIKDSIYKLKN